VLGPTAVDGLVLATGHHRNGILLTPVTADAIARFVLTGEMAEAVRPFAVDRFAAAPKEEA
jgi:glycine oxidase